jgi:hypothetical protein
VVQARLAEERGDKSKHAELKQVVVEFLDGEIAKQEAQEQHLKILDEMRREYKASAAIIPSQEASERLMRYETHLSREIDRTLNRLERLQRRRHGQPLAPQIDVNIS